MTLRLSRAALRDLEDIYVFGARRFGVPQAELYARSITNTLQRMDAHPGEFPEVTHGGETFRRAVSGRHSLYFRRRGDVTVVLRILGGQDPLRLLDGFPDLDL